MATIREHLADAAHTLLGISDSPRLDAELLLGEVLRLSRSSLVARDMQALHTHEERDYATLIQQRAQGAPVAYITGRREFWSLPLKVTPDVLVPRPETELLVQHALTLMPAGFPASVLDLGTGSGAIALSLASERPEWDLTGVDLSAKALRVAAHNSAALGLSRIEWLQGNWFEAVAYRRFHLIVGNPPYIAEGDPALARLAAEPVIALVAGRTGLDALELIIGKAHSHLHPTGWLVLEHGAAQAQAVADLMKQHGLESVRTFLDFSNKPRITRGSLTPLKDPP